MATYMRQGGQVMLMLTDAEARALRDLALYAEPDAIEHLQMNQPQVAAADRACQALAAACNKSARTAASF